MKGPFRLQVHRFRLGSRCLPEGGGFETLAAVSAAWLNYRSVMGLRLADVTSVTVRDGNNEPLGSVSWDGLIFGYVDPMMPSSDQPLLFDPRA